MLVETERLCEYVGYLRRSGDILNIDVRLVDRSNIVVTSVDVLCTRMLDVVFDVIKSRIRVRFDDSWFTEIEMYRESEFSEEDGFFDDVREGNIF